MSLVVFIFLFTHHLCLFHSSHLSELKIQLQSSFETEDSTSEEHPADPDTPVVIVPDQVWAPPDMQQTTASIYEILPTASPDSPTDLVLNSNCPLSEKLRDMRIETSR